jgi:molybdenum cofactor cytidylyltransferase
VNAAIVLAAGRSLRFGEKNKLLALVAGVPMAARTARTLANLPVEQKLAVVSDDRVADLLTAAGFTIVGNRAPEAGLGASLALGRAALGGAGRVLICLADMPFASEGHLRRLLEMPPDYPIVASSSAAGYRGPPLLVRRETLMAARLTGDAGLRELLAGAQLVETADDELRDIDRPADLASG